MGAAPVGAVPLKPWDLGLSHPLGMYQRCQKQSCGHGGKGDKLWDAVFACLVFSLQCQGRLWETLKINIYGKHFVFEY